jgi:diguanylate cyclase (GGDEF)-like protein
MVKNVVVASMRPSPSQPRLETLVEIDLAAGEPLDVVLDRVADAASKLLDLAGASVILWDHQQRAFSLATSTLAGQGPADALERVRREGGATRAIVDSGDPVYVADIAHDLFDTNLMARDSGVRSYAGVPIVADGKTVGVLYALRDEPRAWDPEDRRFLELLAKRAAYAIVNARLLAEARSARERSDALAWVANALIAAEDLGDVLETVVEGAAAALAASRVALSVLDRPTRRVVDYIEGGLVDAAGDAPSYDEIDSGLSGWVLEQQRLAVSDGRVEDARSGPNDDIDGPVVISPIRFGTKLLGLMKVERGPDASPYSEDDIDLVLAVAGQAAVAIENVRLVTATRDSLRETQSLYGLSQELATAEDLEEMLEALAHGVVVALPADRAEVFLGPEGGGYAHHAASGEPPDRDEDAEAPWHADLVAAVRAGEVVRLDADATGTAPVIAAAMRLHERFLGYVIANAAEGAPAFDSRQGELLMTMAAHAAASIDNARLFDQVQHLAITDDLTQAFNRRHLFEVGEYEFDQAQRYQRPFAAIMFDIDHFKAINDTHGHAVGDEVLRWFADRCRQAIRSVDLLGRYGGEEFAVLLPETDIKAAMHIAERIRKLVAEKPVETSRGPIAVTVSAGVAEVHEAMSDVHTLIDRADAAMYFAKRTGRNRVEGG